MSISTTSTKDSYQGNNSIVTQYPITFKYLDESHISVYFDGVPQTEGAGADYVMGGNGTTSTGYITTNVAQAGTVTVSIVLDVPLDQPVALLETGLLPAKTIEVEGFDRLNMQIRRVWRKLGDVLTFSSDEGGTGSTGTADNLLGFDGSGDIAEIPNTTFLQTANDLSEVDAATARTNLGLDAAGTRFALSELTDATITNPVSGETIEWNGSAWVNTVSGSTVDTSDTAPVSPNDGDLWYDSTSGLMYVYYFDGSSSQWVTITSAVSSLDASSVAYTPAGTGAVVTDLQTKARESVSVKDFGAVGDGVADDTVSFQATADAVKAMENGTNKSPVILVPTGSYVISSTITTKATWWLDSGAEILGLGGVSPTFETDTSRLAGSIVRFGGVDQYTTLTVGDPQYTVQKITNKSFSAEVNGLSDNAAGGVSGITYSSASDTVNQGTIGITGVAVNDNTSVSKTVYGIYSEAYRLPNVSGNALCAEFTTINDSNVVTTDPHQQPSVNTGISVPLWLSAGGSYGAVTETNDATAAIGVIGKKGAKFDRGMVFYDNSLTSEEVIAMPLSYEFSWYGSSTNKVASLSNSTYNQRAIGTNTLINHNRSEGSGNTASQSVVASTNYKSNIDGSDYPIASVTASQNSVASGGVAAGRFNYNVKNSSGANRSIQFDDSAYSPQDNLINLGTASRRWKEVFSVNGSINTSDERAKQDIAELNDSEQAVAVRLKGLIRKYKWIDAVEDRGDDARIHVGIIAQDVKRAFEAEELDSSDYSILCYDEWDEQPEILDEDGNIIQEASPAGNRYGVRYNELFAFIISAL